MIKKRVFISFDYDYDIELKNLLVGQAKKPDSPFEIVDMSIKEAIADDWAENARRRIKGCDVVIILCGTHTDRARGVSTELNIARDENIPYFFLEGRKDKRCVLPVGAHWNEKMNSWTWDNLKCLIYNIKSYNLI